jgi:hypothetical protein
VIPDDTAHTDSRLSPGNVILTLRHQNAVVIVDRATGQIVWLNIDFVFGPHSAYMIPNGMPGRDNILVFDNGFAGEWLPVDPVYPVINNRDSSKVQEIRPVLGYLEWTYEDHVAGLLAGTFFSHDEGGAQRLSNGNTLITEAPPGRIFEVTPALQTVWEYVSPYFDANNSNAVYRAFKVPPDWAGSRILGSGPHADRGPVTRGRRP